jgi:hypothetical protein
MTHIGEEDLVLLYYNEPGVPEELRAHLGECVECRAAARDVAQTLNLCNEWMPPETEPEFGRSVWSQIAPLIEEPRRRWWLAWKAPAAVLAMAAIVMAAYLGARASRHPAPSVLTGLSAQARNRILAISLADHLERAQLLLTEISNQSEPAPAELEAERSRAQDLVEEGRLIRETLARGSAATTVSTVALVDDVERFLTELANAPDKPGAAAVKARQERIASGSLLFKVRIFESNLRTEGRRL